MTAQAASSKTESALTPWWLILIEGIAAIILGIFLLISPAATIFVVVQFLGFYWLITGIFSLISIFIDRTMWGWKLFSGVLGILAGILIIQNPLWSALLVPATLVIVMGVFGIVIGIMNLFQAFRGGGWGIGVLGVLSILFGLLLLGRPLLATLSLPLVLGIAGIVFGVLALFGAFRAKRAEEERRAASKLGAATAAQAEGTVRPEPQVAPAAPIATAPASEAAGAAAVAGATAFAVAEEARKEAIEAPSPAVAGVGESGEAAPSEKAGDEQFMNLEENAKFKYELEYVEGIGPVYADKFRAVGVNTIQDFYEKGASAAGRTDLAESTGISGKLILEWINHVDLYRIKGVGSEYADLLEEAGVDTVVELATRNPANLFEKMVAVNAEKKLVRRVPVQSQVEDWVYQAKMLPRRVTY